MISPLKVQSPTSKNSWVQRDDVRKWWQGANPCMPITNNGLERANAILKGDSGREAWIGGAPGSGIYFSTSVLCVLIRTSIVFAPSHNVFAPSVKKK